MAKKKAAVKKKTTKASKTVRHHHYWDDHHFLIVAGGGFIIISFILLLNGNVSSFFPSRNQSVVQEQVMDANNKKVVPSTREISIYDFSYGERTISVKRGTTVVWKNVDSVTHTATADDGSFDTGVIEAGGKKSITFNNVGTFTYHCTMHPNMTGTVVVEE